MDTPDGWAMPLDLVAATEREGRQGWLAALPAKIRQLEAKWALDIGEPFQPGDQTAWVAPAVRGGEDLVVKVLWRRPEAEHEADGLAAWDGHGAVRLDAACEVDAETLALLLERCRPGATLRALPEPDQDLVVAGLLRRLWIDPPADHGFAALGAMCDLWADEFEEKTAKDSPRLDPGLAREAITLFRELPATAEREVLLCTDLHAGNVLAAEREPGWSSTPSPTSATRPTTPFSTCSTATSGSTPIPRGPGRTHGRSPHARPPPPAAVAVRPVRPGVTRMGRARRCGREGGPPITGDEARKGIALRANNGPSLGSRGTG